MNRGRRVVAGQSGSVDISRESVKVGRDVVDQDQTVATPILRLELDHAFQPLAEAVAGNSQASQQVEALKREAAKGYNADDGVLARLVKSIIGLVPGAVTALLSTFGAPALGGVAGPVTKWVLSEIQFK